MYEDLTPTQKIVYDLLYERPLKATEIAEELDYSSTSVVYDHISGMRSHGVDVYSDETGKYRLGESESVENNYTMRHQAKPSQQTITKRANEFFAEFEQIVKPRLERYRPAEIDGGFVQREGGVDLVVHITDTHIGDLVKRGDEIEFNSEIAVHRVKQIFQEAHRYAAELEEVGYTIDTVHLLLGGDLVTNEAIYDSQPWEVEINIKEQIRTAVELFDEEIAGLADHFPCVQVVCQDGNHGEFRVEGSSGEANADGFVFCMLDYLVRKGEYDNIAFANNERQWHTNFEMRDGKWTGHLRHGQNTRGHVGTSSPQSDWQSWMNNTNGGDGADIAFYGHFHQFKEERLPGGEPIIMGGAIVPPDEYAESMAAFDGPMSAIHVVDDNQVLKDTRRIYFG